MLRHDLQRVAAVLELELCAEQLPCIWREDRSITPSLVEDAYDIRFRLCRFHLLHVTTYTRGVSRSCQAQPPAALSPS
eukprot:COSAG06_NODE_2507_length_6747_cov_38.233604_5_plen_78_part_00